MNVFMVGGTGLLGSMAAVEFINKGHHVKTLALPGVPTGAELPKEMEIAFGNYIDMSDDELLEMMKGADCFVFAAGIDERIEFEAPVYEKYYKYNIAPIKRFFALAKQCKMTKAVVLGSYFTHVNREHPELELCKYHPYIRSRNEQERVAVSFADDNFSVAILELPYIFGTQKGRRPVWTVFTQQLSIVKSVTLFPKGGTAVVTAAQVGQAIVGAAEKNVGANIYPIAMDNYSWKKLMHYVHIGMGQPKRPFIHISKGLFKIYAKKITREAVKKGLEPGLDQTQFYKVMYENAFIDTSIAKSLGVRYDDIPKAIYESIVVSADAIENEGNYMQMKGE